MSCLQIVSSHHFVDLANMVPAIPVTLPPCSPRTYNFLTRTPFFGGQNPEALQKILHLEIFWGFGTRTAAAGGGQYLSGGGVGRGDGRPGRCRAAGGRHPGRRQAVGAEKEGGRGIDKAAIA